MLGDKIRELRISCGLSQEDLAARLHVVRQTVSKWEKSLSVPDAEMLCRLAEELGVSVSTLLGAEENEKTPPAVEEKEAEAPSAEYTALAEKLEALNRQLAEKNERSRKGWRWAFLALAAASGLLAVWNLLPSIVQIVVEKQIEAGIDGSVGIIGGADGPTAILVSSTGVDYSGWILVVLLAVVAVIGLVKTRKK